MFPTQSSDCKRGMVAIQSVSTTERYLKLVYYVLLTELVRYMATYTHISVYISMHVHCLGKERIFSFDLSKAIILCKKSQTESVILVTC